MFSNIVVGLVTGGISSWIVASVFYRYGRRDTEKAEWASQLDILLYQLARLDPNRIPSQRPGDGDGVDDTSHSLLCRAAVLESIGFSAGAKLAKEIAGEMVERCSTGALPTYEDGQKVKRGWGDRLRDLRRTLVR